MMLMDQPQELTELEKWTHIEIAIIWIIVRCICHALLFLASEISPFQNGAETIRVSWRKNEFQCENKKNISEKIYLVEKTPQMRGHSAPVFVGE